MKNYLSLAHKELRVQKVTSLLILLAIILSTMMTAVIGQSAGVLSAMRQQQAITLCGNRYASFVQCSAQQVEILRQDQRLSFVGTYLTLGTAELNRSLSLALLEYQEDVAAIYPGQARLKAGRLPEAPGEIALPEDVLQYLGLSGQPGETITLSMEKTLRHGITTEAYNFTADFTLVGVTEGNYLGYTAGLVTGLAGAGTTESLLPDNYIYYTVDFRTADKASFQNTMNDLINQLNIHELDAIYNLPLLDALAIPYNANIAYEKLAGIDAEGFGFILAAGIMVGALLLLAAGLVIYNILKISVSRRVKQYGVLRAIGGCKGQLYRLVTAQVLLLCLIGVPIGLLLGLFSAQGILTAATSLLSPDIFLVQNSAELNSLIAENSSGKGIFLLASVAITLIFALAAAVPAAAYAANVSPTVAMAGQSVKIKRRRPRRAKKIRSFERYYARLNLRRSPGRTALTVFSLVMSITVFITLQNGLALLNTANKVTQHIGDYSIVNETVGFSQEDLQDLQNTPEVTAVAALQLQLYDVDANADPEGVSIEFKLHPGETFQIAGLNDAFWDALFAGRLDKQVLEQLKTGQGCLIRNPLPLIFDGEEIPRTEIPAGSTITINGQTLPVLDTLDGYDTYISVGNGGFVNGVQVIVSPELYTQLTGLEAYHEFKPTLASNADRPAFDKILSGFALRIPGTTWLSYAETDRQFTESFAQIQLLGWGLILFVGLIGILNIINTVYTNIHTRVNEIGIQRAIGMSNSSLYAAFLWEGAYYGLLASAIGAVSGWLCTILLNAATDGILELCAFPLASTLEAAAISVLACLLATLIPLRPIGRMSIVKAIENID